MKNFFLLLFFCSSIVYADTAVTQQFVTADPVQPMPQPLLQAPFDIQAALQNPPASPPETRTSPMAIYALPPQTQQPEQAKPIQQTAPIQQAGPQQTQPIEQIQPKEATPLQTNSNTAPPTNLPMTSQQPVPTNNTGPYDTQAEQTWFSHCTASVTDTKMMPYAQPFCACGWKKISGGGLDPNLLTSDKPADIQKADQVLQGITQQCLMEVMKP